MMFAIRSHSRFQSLKAGLAYGGALSLPFIALGCLTAYAYVDHVRARAESQRVADLDCLARNVYYEARGEPLVGQYAVAEVTMNRVASRFFPDTVCEVVYEFRWDSSRQRNVGAFSWTELSLPPPYGFEWRKAKAVASTVYDNQEAPFVSGALFFHATYISPDWAGTKNRVARIGRHLFYE